MGNIYHEWNGTILTITSDSGTSSCDLKGATGDNGVRGAQGAKGEIGVGIAGDKGEKGDRGSSIIKTELTGTDAAGGNIYTQTFDDGYTTTFTAPKGDTGKVETEVIDGLQAQIDKNAADIALILDNPDTDTVDSIKELISYIEEDAEATTSLQTQITSNKNSISSIQTNYAKKSELLDLIYPIGSIYLSVNNMMPQTLFGGTWEMIQDTFLLAAGSKYSAGTTGGSADAVAVSHTHTFEVTTGDSLKVAYNYSTLNATGTTYNYPSVGTGAGGDNNGYIRLKESGVDGTGKNMPPYLAVYVWKRTA